MPSLYRYDRVPCDSRNGRVVESDLKRDGRLHIHFVVEAIGGLPTSEYGALFKFADRKTAQVRVASEGNVPDSAYIHSSGFSAAKVNRPVLVDDGQLVQEPSMDSCPSLRTLKGCTASMASRVFSGIPRIL